MRKSFVMDNQSNQHEINYILNCKKQAKEASKVQRERWLELWQIYQNYQVQKKEKWQSKCFVPKLFMVVERAAGLIERAILQTSKLFKVVLRQSEDVPKDLEDKLPALDKKFKAKLDNSNFANIYSEAAKSGLLLGLSIPKVLWDFEDENLDYENINILNCYISPDYKPFQKANPKYFIEYKEMELTELLQLAKKTNAQARANIIHTSQLKRIQEDYIDEESRSKIRETQAISHYRMDTKKVGIDEFWGDIPSEDGKKVVKNQLCWLANGKYLIRHQDNPFEHEKIPYIITMPIRYPHRGYAGISIIEAEAKLQYIYNNIINMTVDAMNWRVNPVFQALDTNLKDPEALTTLYPGKIVHTQQTVDAVKQVTTAPIGSDVFKLLESIDYEMQKGHGITEFIEGTVGKQRKTLGEIEIKTAESQGMFDVIARRLERNSLRPLLELSYELLVQYSKDFDAETKEHIQFKVGGLSVLLLQKRLLDSIEKALMYALKVPELKELTDISILWEKFLSIINLSEVYIEKEEEEEREEMPAGERRPSPEETNQRAAEAAQETVEQILQLTGAGMR